MTHEQYLRYYKKNKILRIVKECYSALYAPNGNRPFVLTETSPRQGIPTLCVHEIPNDLQKRIVDTIEQYIADIEREMEGI